MVVVNVKATHTARFCCAASCALAALLRQPQVELLYCHVEFAIEMILSKLTRTAVVFSSRTRFTLAHKTVPFVDILVHVVVRQFVTMFAMRSFWLRLRLYRIPLSVATGRSAILFRVGLVVLALPVCFLLAISCVSIFSHTPL